MSTFFEKIPWEHLRAGGGGEYLRWISKRSAILQAQWNYIEYYCQYDESVLACVVYPLHRRNCPINAANSPTRQDGWGKHLRYMHGTLYVCTDTETACMQRRLAGFQSVSQAMWLETELWLVRLISEREANQDPDGSEPWTGRSSPDVPFRHDPGVGRSHPFPWFETRSWMNRPVMQPWIIDMYGVRSTMMYMHICKLSLGPYSTVRTQTRVLNFIFWSFIQYPHATRKASVYPCLWIRLQNVGPRSPDSCSSGRPVRTQNSEMGFLDQVGRRICYYCKIHILKPTGGPLSGKELYDVQSTRWVERDSGLCLGFPTLGFWGPLWRPITHYLAKVYRW